MIEPFQLEVSENRFGVRVASLLTCALLLVLGLGGCAKASAVLSGEVILDPTVIEEEIESGVLEQGGFVVTAECPDPLSGKVGDTRQCLIEDEFGVTALVDVRIQNSEGYIIWEVQE